MEKKKASDKRNAALGITKKRKKGTQKKGIAKKQKPVLIDDDDQKDNEPTETRKQPNQVEIDTSRGKSVSTVGDNLPACVTVQCKKCVLDGVTKTNGVRINCSDIRAARAKKEARLPPEKRSSPNALYLLQSKSKSPFPEHTVCKCGEIAIIYQNALPNRGWVQCTKCCQFMCKDREQPCTHTCDPKDLIAKQPARLGTLPEHETGEESSDDSDPDYVEKEGEEEEEEEEDDGDEDENEHKYDSKEAKRVESSVNHAPVTDKEELEPEEQILSQTQSMPEQKEEAEYTQTPTDASQASTRKACCRAVCATCDSLVDINCRKTAFFKAVELGHKAYQTVLKNARTYTLAHPLFDYPMYLYDVVVECPTCEKKVPVYRESGKEFTSCRKCREVTCPCERAHICERVRDRHRLKDMRVCPLCEVSVDLRYACEHNCVSYFGSGEARTTPERRLEHIELVNGVFIKGLVRFCDVSPITQKMITSCDLPED